MSTFWDWVEYTLGPAVRADRWYNGEIPIGQRGFMSDRVSRTMGYAVIRQLRVKPGICHVVPKVSGHVHDCYAAYSIISEDKSSYNFGWTRTTSNATEQTVSSEYVYRTASELNGWPYVAKYAVYGGGGYVAELKGSKRDVKQQLARLKDGLWLDRRTRAVFVEFTVYNPNINLFGILTMVVEFTKSSFIDKSFRVEPMNLLPSTSGANILNLGAQLAFVLFIVWFLAREIRNGIKLKRAYFWNIWNYNEIAIILLGICSVGVYLYRMALAKAKTAFFKQTHGDAYMKFQYIAYWNELLLYMVGWLCFLSTVKFLRLLRFNKKMNLLGSVLAISSRPLVGYVFMFSIWLMAFCQAFYLKYVESDENFSTITSTLESLLLILVGKITNFHEMLGLNQSLGILLFIIYIVVICYVMFEMFMAILGGAIDEARADVRKRANEFEIIEYMYTRFTSWTGLDGLLRRLAGGMTRARQHDSNVSAERRQTAGRLSSDTVDQLIRNLNKNLDKLMEYIITQQKYGSFETAFLANPNDGRMELRPKEAKVMTSNTKLHQ